MSNYLKFIHLLGQRSCILFTNNNYHLSILFVSFIILLSIISPMSKITAKEIVSEKNIFKNHILVFDNSISTNIPKRYRHGANLSPPLYVSSSAQPNLKDFEYIIQYSKKKTRAKSNSRIFIIDLRQEPHAMLDGKAVSWYGLKNQVPNYYEKHLINQLKKSTNIKVYTGINKLPEGRFIPKGYIFTTNKNLLTEQQLVNQLGAKYLRLLVTDHFAPNNHEINVFVDFIKKLPKNSWVHFHCRGGRGRSTTFMAMLDIIQNSKQLTLDAIIERQKKLGGINLAKTEFSTERKKWKTDPAKQRYDFIKNFYEYVIDPNGYTKSSWLEWDSKYNKSKY